MKKMGLDKKLVKEISILKEAKAEEIGEEGPGD